MANTTCLPIVPSPQSQAGYDCWQPCAGGLQHADDLVRHIRRRHGAHFSLGVVGFPEAHPESRAGAGAATEAERAEDVRRLKRKVDAGSCLTVLASPQLAGIGAHNADVRALLETARKCARRGFTEVAATPAFLALDVDALVAGLERVRKIFG